MDCIFLLEPIIWKKKKKKMYGFLSFEPCYRCRPAMSRSSVCGQLYFAGYKISCSFSELQMPLSLCSPSGVFSNIR
jgi:hypothetical protein